MENHLLELKGNYDHSYSRNPVRKSSFFGNKDLQYILPSVVFSPLVKKRNLFIKRMFDVVVSIVVISLLLSWLLPLIALLVKMDSSGPIFFLQKRNKKDGKHFYCIKLRTMIVNEDADHLAAVINDKRITRLGRFLRNSHLDELPQFINVLIGDMSIIGPRPHMIMENIKYRGILDSYNDRHHVKPGITGLAQSFGYYGPVNNLYHLNKKVEYDVFYIKNWSFKMDVKIMARTIKMIYKKFN